VPFGRRFFDETFGMTNFHIIPKWLGSRAAKMDIPVLSAHKEDLYRQVARSILKPLDGVPDLLTSLAAAGFRMAIGSSGPRANVEMVLEILAARDKFAAMATLEEVSAGKPDPQVFLVAARKLALPPSRCVVIEDAPQGVEAGLAAGAKVLAVTSTRPAGALRHAHLIVNSLRQVDAKKLQALIDQ
jgi:HAD superfamily hydrolase (TIGR01509 family)